MNHNFKPGDLALIVGTVSHPQNIGKTCELIEHLDPGQVSHWKDSEGFHQKNDDTSAAWIVSGHELSGDGVRGSLLVDSKHLMPLRGDFAPERQKAQEVTA